MMFLELTSQPLTHIYIYISFVDTSLTRHQLAYMLTLFGNVCLNDQALELQDIIARHSNKHCVTELHIAQHVALQQHANV